MGDAEAGRVRLSFNPQLRVEFRGATVTSDAGLLLPASWTSASTDTRSGSSRPGAPDPACPVLHPPACRELLDTAPRQANSRAHRAPRMAPHVIEKAGHGGGESGALLRGASLARIGARATFGRWAVCLEDAAGTARVTHSERQNGRVARHVVRSATRGNEDLGPNRRSRG